MTLTFDLWPPKPFQQCRLTWHTCPKFHRNPSTNYRGITSCRKYVNGRMDNGWPAREAENDAFCLLLLLQRHTNWTATGDGWFDYIRATINIL